MTETEDVAEDTCVSKVNESVMRRTECRNFWRGGKRNAAEFARWRRKCERRGSKGFGEHVPDDRGHSFSSHDDSRPGSPHLPVAPVVVAWEASWGHRLDSVQTMHVSFSRRS